MRVLGVAMVVAAAIGCTSIRVDFLGPPPAELLAAIEPGVTTRAEVLRRLGPPEELRRPSPFERARFSTPQRRKVVEGGDLFGRGAYTYAAGRQRVETFGFLPVGPALFKISRTRSTEDRWRIEFDASDVVTSVSHVAEHRSGDADG